MLRIDNNLFQKTRQQDYKRYTIARLKQLKYIDYELIEAKERAQADEENKEDLRNDDQNEGNDNNDEQSQ